MTWCGHDDEANHPHFCGASSQIPAVRIHIDDRARSIIYWRDPLTAFHLDHRMKASFLGIAALATSTVASSQTPGLTGTLVVTNKTPSTATIIDVASKRTLATLPTGNGPHEVVISSDGRLAVVSDYSGQPGRTLTVIDVPALRVVRTIDLGQYNRPHGMVFLPGDSIVIVTSEASGNVV